MNLAFVEFVATGVFVFLWLGCLGVSRTNACRRLRKEKDEVVAQAVEALATTRSRLD